MAEQTTWDRYAAKGESAFAEQNYREAEACWYTAMKVAEFFGDRDPRLIESIEKLATVYKALERDQDAERMKQRAVHIKSRITGVNLQPPSHMHQSPLHT